MSPSDVKGNLDRPPTRETYHIDPRRENASELHGGNAVEGTLQCNVSLKTSNSYHLDKWRYRIVYKWDMGGESVLCWAWTLLLDMDFSIIKNFKSGHYTDLRGHLLEQSKFQVSGRNHL